MFEEVALPSVAWQPSLLDAGVPAVATSLSGRVRHALDAASWVDHVPGWLTGSDQVFADLLGAAQWQARQVVMWGRLVAEPRLTARWPAGELPAVLERIRAVLEETYGVGFDSVGVNLYRDGAARPR